MSKYPFKTNQWTEETREVEVITPVVNEQGQMRGTQKEKMPVTEKIYRADAPPKQAICGDHDYKCVDRHNYIFKCKNCGYSRVAFPCTYKFSKGKLIRRDK